MLLTSALVVGAAGCGGGGDDDATAPPADGGGTITTAPGTTTEPADAAEPADPGITAPPTTFPEGSVVVPVDPDLADALPRLAAGERQISTSRAFDERLCTGDKAPALPKSQARATYAVSADETITIAGYRFSPADAPLYLADYAEAVRACAVEAGEPEGLGVPDALGQSFGLTTSRGTAYIVMGLRDDVIWILFQETTGDEVEILPATYDTFIRLLGA